MGNTNTKARIMREAMRLFIQRGIDSVSVRDIADAVGMSAPNLYAHFKGGRDQLVREMFTQGYSAYGDRLCTIAKEPTSARSRLRNMIQEICLLHAEDEELFTFLLLTQHQQLASIPRDKHNPVEIIYRLITEGVNSGEFTTDGTTDNIGIITAAIVGIVLQIAIFKIYHRIRHGLLEQSASIIAMCMKIVGEEPC
jgi:AcrR family transcriptional regulator